MDSATQLTPAHEQLPREIATPPYPPQVGGEGGVAEEELCRERDLAGALVEAAAVVSSTLDPDQVLDRILEQVSRVVPNDAANIMLIEEGDQARPVRWRGYERFGAEEFISAVVFHLPDVPGLQRMLESREPLVIPDTANWPDWVRIPVTDWLRSYAAAPIVVRGEVIGFLNVDSATSNFFTQTDAEALRAFAGHAAVAIENARLYQEAQQELAERKRVREALRESEQKYRTLVEQSLQGLVVIQNFRIVFANTAFAEISGYTIEELLSLSPEQVRAMVHPEDQALVWGRFRDRLEGKPVSPHYEYRGVRKDGAVRWLDMYANRIEYQGQPAVQATFVDITERRRAEEALRESEELYKTLVQTSPDAVTATDLEGRITYVSQRTLDLHGFASAEELLGRSAFELIAAEDHERAIVNLRKTLEEGFIRNKEYVLLKKDGTRFAGELSAALIQDADGKPKAFIATTRDITERKMAERALERRASQLAMVNEIGRQIASILELDQLLHQIVHLLNEASGYRYVSIFLLDEDSNDLVLRAGAGDRMVPDGTRIPLEARSINTHVTRTGEPLLVNDVSQEPLYLLIEEMADTRSELCVPIKVKGQVIGTLDVQSTELHAFDESDLSTLQTLAHQAAIAIENARLFAETKRNANDLTLLLGTSTAISSTLDLDQILETVAHQITTSLVSTFCRITLLDETRENLVIRATSPIRDQEAKGALGRRCPLATVPWHRQVIETAEPVILRQDVPERALSDEEREIALTEEVKSAVLIPLIVGGRVLGVISLGEERSWERSPFTREKVELCQSIAAQAAVAIENARLYQELQQSFIQTIATLAAAVEAKDPHTGGHSQRATELAVAIAQELGLSEEEIELIRYAGLLHDVGKIGISEQILLKPGPLNVKEWEVVRRHPALGANIVERAALLQKLVPIILYHHEHYDGQGYPEGLRGEDIPLKARILAVADAFEAMTSGRAYRPAMTVEQALATLREGADRQWDGKLVEILHRIIQEQGHQK